jgi:hypothetical protein
MRDQGRSTTTKRALGAIADAHRAEGERALARHRARRAAALVGLPDELRLDPEAFGPSWDRAYQLHESGVYP